LSEKILFYSRKKEYGFLSNFEPSLMIIDGRKYKTNEHYYQSQKAISEEIREWIRTAPTPFLAMRGGRSLRAWEIEQNWESMKEVIMLKGLREKFSQNYPLRKKLLDTGDATLHEDSPKDKYWGIKGKDRLGKLLMQVRDEIREGKLPLKDKSCSLCKKEPEEGQICGRCDDFNHFEPKEGVI